MSRNIKHPKIKVQVWKNSTYILYLSKCTLVLSTIACAKVTSSWSLGADTHVTSSLWWELYEQQQVSSPDEDDDRGGLGHGSDHAAHTDHTQEGEEGLLTARTGTLPRQSHRLLTGAGYTRAAGQVLTRGREKRSKCCYGDLLHCVYASCLKA